MLDAIVPARFERFIRIAGRPGQVRVSLEDPVHHFRIELWHDDATITDVRSESVRFPFSLCPAAGDQLRELIGVALTDDVSSITRQINARQQCTHQFDAALFGVTAAASKIRKRAYRAVVHNAGGQKAIAILFRNDTQICRWEVEDGQIQDGGRFNAIGMGTGFTAWVSRHLNAIDGEAALILRRAAFVALRHAAMSRRSPAPTASARGGCWVQQPGRADAALRLPIEDFEDRSPERFTRGDDDWLAYSPPMKKP